MRQIHWLFRPAMTSCGGNDVNEHIISADIDRASEPAIAGATSDVTHALRSARAQALRSARAHARLDSKSAAIDVRKRIAAGFDVTGRNRARPRPADRVHHPAGHDREIRPSRSS
jgi:hypothetical protein